MLIAAALAVGAAVSVEADEPPGGSAPDLIFVTDDNAQGVFRGCDAISVVSRTDGHALTRGEYRQSPGQLAATSDGTLVLAAATNNGLFLDLLRWESQPAPRWVTRFVDTQILRGSALGVSPGDDFTLFNTTGGFVEAHAVDQLILGHVGGPLGTAHVGQVADLVFSWDGLIAYVVNTTGQIHVLHIPSLAAAQAPIEYPPVQLPRDTRLRNTHASLSPDGSLLAINTVGPSVTVVNLADGTSAKLGVTGLRKTYGIAFNYAHTGGLGEPLLAVHGRSSVAVFELQGAGNLERAAMRGVPPQSPPELTGAPDWSRIATLAWSGAGDAIVAAVGGKKEFRVLDFALTPPSLSRSFDFDSCEATISTTDFGQQFDVLTLHDRLHIKTPTTTPTAPPTPSPTPPATATSLPTSTTESTRTATPTASASATTTPTPTPAHRLRYLPLLLRERCQPDKRLIDVALVIDASTSMLEPASSGHSKLAAAVRAAGIFLDQLQLDAGDQASVVSFNAGAQVLQVLTDDRGSLDAALAAITAAEKTRIHLGVQVAREELASDRHRSENTPVMVVLTDGRANSDPVSLAIEQARLAKREGVIVFAIGLGNELDVEALKQMASEPSGYYHAPTAAELAAIYVRIAVEIPCPAEEFWP